MLRHLQRLFVLKSSVGNTLTEWVYLQARISPGPVTGLPSAVEQLLRRWKRGGKADSGTFDGRILGDDSFTDEVRFKARRHGHLKYSKYSLRRCVGRRVSCLSGFG